MTNVTKVEAVREANALLTNAGMPSYTELFVLLLEAKKLGLQFDIGSAYIRRAFIDQQDDLVSRINAASLSAMHAAFEA